MNAAARGISEMALGWLRTVRRVGRGDGRWREGRGKGTEGRKEGDGTTKEWKRGGRERILLFEGCPGELRIAPRGVALFMAAIDHRPASAGPPPTPLPQPPNRHMTTVFILKSPASTYDALILIVSLALSRAGARTLVARREHPRGFSPRESND